MYIWPLAFCATSCSASLCGPRLFLLLANRSRDISYFYVRRCRNTAASRSALVKQTKKWNMSESATLIIGQRKSGSDNFF